MVKTVVLFLKSSRLGDVSYTTGGKKWLKCWAYVYYFKVEITPSSASVANNNSVKLKLGNVYQQNQS